MRCLSIQRWLSNLKIAFAKRRKVGGCRTYDGSVSFEDLTSAGDSEVRISAVGV